MRLVQALVQAAPTIVVGLMVAGVLRHLVGYQGTRRLFGDGTWRSLPQAWVVGMLLPVCSLGVIPVVREMRKAGVSGGALLAFGLTAPLFNPISVLYGLTLSDPVALLVFCFCSLVIVTVVGITWDWLFTGSTTTPPDPPAVSYGVRRMLAIASVASREAVGPAACYILVGLAGVGLLSVLLPLGALQQAAEHDDVWAPLFMTGIAIPAYATPMTAMVQLGAMFQHGNSVGAAFALLALGAGANLGLVAWMTHNYGLRRTFAWFAVLVGVVIGLAYAVDRPLYPHGVEPAGHTHAFDIYCCPFHDGTTGAFRLAVDTVRQETAPHEWVGVAVLTLLVFLGACLALFDPQSRFETWLAKQPERKAGFDVVLPGPVLGGVALVGLVAASVLGCYVYYPPPSEILEEMKIVNTEVVVAANSRDWDTAAYWIPVYDDWTRKLQVSMFLRGQRLSEDHRAKASALRDNLEALEHEVEEREAEESRDLGKAVNHAFRCLQAAYAEDPSARS